ncbi:haloacid dehalogenase-like hydrolase [Streptomyces sp. NPDC046161]|uniref:HAD family hydrolase n=1 Tax=Streptomyces sp. NPDC046161 TaxID=3155132 RepID=UPI0033E05BB2
MTETPDQYVERPPSTPDPARSVRYAVFDLDGTLHPDSLGILLLQDLHVSGICTGEPTEHLFRFLRALDQEHLHQQDRVATAYQMFAQALRGCEAGQVRDVARRLWKRERHRVFAYAVPLLEVLRSRGTTLILISGSPQEVVAPVAVSLGFARWRGAVLASRDGRYTGTYLHTPAAPRQKLALATEMIGGKENLPYCAAVGNSSTDIELLAGVGRPVAFEAGPGLAAAARRRGWPLADRHTLTAAHLGPPPAPGSFPCRHDRGEGPA